MVAPSPETFVPPPVRTLKDLELPVLWLHDLALKILYFRGYLTGHELAKSMALPYMGVVSEILEELKKEKLVEIRGARTGVGPSAYEYTLTNLGMQRAREALERSQYAGPVPVPYHRYVQAVRKQARNRPIVTEREVRKMFAHLILKSEIIHRLGPAINSGLAIFLYGPPGNGKTSIAQAIGRYLLRDAIYIPFALYIGGQVIVLFDTSVHHPVEVPNSNQVDARWVRVRRPFLMVGGELTLEDLDLIFDPVNKFYQAPVQVKANGGMLLVDDFGRQRVRPQTLLNRWIVPLESRVDYLTLHTGQKIEVPFDVLLVFSTNLPPKDLVDEAFLRRLRHKIQIGDPGFKEFREIFRRVAEQRGISFSERGLAYLIQEWYVKPGRSLRASHPRDLCDILLDIARYRNAKPSMTQELLEEAAKVYFVDV